MLVYHSYHRNPTWGFIGLVQIWGTPPLNPNSWVETCTPDGKKGWLRLDTPQNSRIEKGVAAAAGPIASLLSAIFGLLVVYKSDKPAFKHTGLMLALVVSFSMVLYYLRSPLRSIGDEYDMATQFNIAKVLVEIPFALAFVFCFVLGLRQLDSWSIRLKWLAATLLGSVSSGILLMITDGWIRDARIPKLVPIESRHIKA